MVSGGSGDGSFGAREARGPRVDVECLGLVRGVYIGRQERGKGKLARGKREMNEGGREKGNAQATTKSPSSHCKTAVESF